MSPLGDAVPNGAGYGCNKDYMDHCKVDMKCHLAHVNGANTKAEVRSAASHHFTRKPRLFCEEAAD